MSAFVAPLLWVHGKVRNLVERNEPEIPALDPLAAEYDDQGNLIRSARPGREAVPARTLWDVLIDTHRDGAAVPAGLIEVVMTEKSAEATGGYLPNLGDDIVWPVRGYQKWVGPQGRRRSTNAYSFAGDVYAADEKSAPGGKQRPVSAVANA